MDARGQFVASLLDASSRSLAAGVVNRLIDPENPAEAGPSGGFQSRLADIESRIAHLAESLAVGNTDLFVAHVEWLRGAYQARQVPIELLDASLACLRDELAERLGQEQAEPAFQHVDAARSRLGKAAGASHDEHPPLAEGPLVDHARRFLLCQLEGRRDDALRMIEALLADGTPVSDIEVHVVARAQAAVGRMWQRGEIQIAEEHMGSAIVEEAIALLGSRIDVPVRDDRCALIASVAGNMHDFGARVVSHHFRLAGWRTYFMGADTPASEILWAVDEYAPHALALSIALPLQVRTTASLIAQLRTREACPKIIVGGPPIQTVPGLWASVGADLGSTDVQTLTDQVEQLL